jgi:probable HAF family extracellular repeat protein
VGETNHHAIFWQNGVMTDLGNLPGLPTSQADGINNQGQVVGFSNNGADETSSVAVLSENGTINRSQHRNSCRFSLVPDGSSGHQ